MKTAHLTLQALALAGIVAGVAAQQPTFTRSMLQQVDISVPGREAVTALVVFQPGGTPGRHTHAGEEIGYLIEGALRIEIDGTAPMTIGAGKAFVIPNGAIHNATNIGTGTARLVVTYVVEKGKPLATPAPAG